MKHARQDYNRIQDPDGLIPEDEPVFLLRGQDIAAPQTVRFWAQEAERNGASFDIVNSARAQANDMIEWQRHHNVKVPDMPSV